MSQDDNVIAINQCKVPWCDEDLSKPEEAKTGWPICASCMRNTIRRSMEEEEPGSFKEENAARAVQWARFIAANIDVLLKHASYPTDAVKLEFEDED